MRRYTLASAGQPSLSKFQAEAVYGFLQPFGALQTLDELVRKAKQNNYKRLFKRPDSATERASLQYHLSRFRKRGIVRIIED